MYYMVFCVSAILAISMIIGAWRGLLKTVFSLLAIVLSLTIAYVATPTVRTLIMDYTQTDEIIDEWIYKKIETTIQEKLTESFTDAGVKNGLSELVQKEAKKMLTEDTDKATQVQLIDSLGLPNYLEKSFLENNNDTAYNTLGVTDFYHYLSSYTTLLICNILAFCLLFIVFRLVIPLAYLIIYKMLKKLPILSAIDRVGGMIVGLVVGLTLVWVFMIIAGIAFGSQYDEMIAGNEFLEILSRYNLLIKIVTNIDVFN